MTLKRPPSVIQTNGQLMDTSRFSRVAIQEVFERIGGVDRLAVEADQNPKWFFEKMFAKTIQPEKVVEDKEKTVAELLAELDSKMGNVSPMVIEGEADGTESE